MVVVKEKHVLFESRTEITIMTELLFNGPQSLILQEPNMQFCYSCKK